MFGIILPSRPMIVTTAENAVSPTQLAFKIPPSPSFSHIVVTMLPGNSLPQDTAAAVYLQLPDQTDFKFLGAIDQGKQSAIFAIKGFGSTNLNGANGLPTNGEVDMDADIPTPSPANSQGDFTLGISVESISSVALQLASLESSTSLDPSTTVALASRTPASTPVPQGSAAPNTKVLAQRIIKNAFNFLASFEGGDGMVSLKSFEGWWRKFERKVEMDPGFLEREGE